MQYRQPRQRPEILHHNPSPLLYVALTDKRLTQGGCSQCMQGMGMICVFTAGYSPSQRNDLVPVRCRGVSCPHTARPCGTLFPALQASEQAWHPRTCLNR